MASDSARLQIVIEAQNTSASGIAQVQRQMEALGVSVTQVGVATREVGEETQQFARLVGTAATQAGANINQLRQQAEALSRTLQGATGEAARVTTPDIARVAAAQAAAAQRAADQQTRDAQRTADQQAAAAKKAADAQIAEAQRAAAQIALLQERLSSGGAAQVQVVGLSPQQVQAMAQSFHAANVEATQLGATVNRAGQVVRTIQLQPGQGGARGGLLGVGLQELQQAEVSGVRFTDQLSRGLAGATEEMSKLAQGIGHGLGLFSSFGAGIGTAVVTAAITKAVADTSKQFAIFEEQLRGTNALLGQTGQASEQSFQQANREVRAFAVATGTDAVDDVHALYQAISAGSRTAPEQFQVLGAAANLAVGGLTNERTAVDALTTVLNAYHLSTGSAAQVSDQLFAATRAGKITIDQLAQGLGTAVPVASALGVNFGELAGVIASATNQGVQAGAAFEGTRAALNAFLRPTAEAQQIAARLGFEFDANVVKTKGFTGALNDVVRATGGSEQLLGALFGDIQAVNTVLAITGPNATATARAISTVGSASGDAARAADEVNQSLGRSFAEMSARFNELRLRVGEVSAGPLKDTLLLVEQIGAALGAWPDAVPTHDQVGRFQALDLVAKSIAESFRQAASGGGPTGFIGGVVSGALGAAVTDVQRGLLTRIPAALATATHRDQERADEEAARAQQRQAQADADRAAREAEAARKAAQVRLPELLPQAFAPQEAEIAVQQANLNQQADEARLTFERQLDPLQRQLQTMEAMRDITADLSVLHLNLERITLEENNQAARALDLENQNLSALEQRNQARRQQITLGLTVPILQRVATAAGANVSPDSPEFARLNIAQQFIALRLSDAQAQLRQAQIATDPGRTTFEQQGRELDFRTKTAQLAAEELKTRLQIDELPIEQHIKQIQLAESNRLTPLQRQTEELKLQADFYDRQKAAVQWLITHLPQDVVGATVAAALPPETVGRIASGQPLTPEDQAAIAKAVGDLITARLPQSLGGNGPNPPTPPAPPTPPPDQGVVAAQATADAAQAAAAAASDAANAASTAASPGGAAAVPQSQAPPNTLVPGGELDTGAPLGTAPPGVSAATAAAAGLRIPIIRGTGVSQSRNITLHQQVTVDASGQSSPDEIAHAVATATATKTLDALQAGWDNAPSADSAGGRYG